MLVTNKGELAQKVAAAICRTDPVTMNRIEIPVNTKITVIATSNGLQVTVEDNDKEIQASLVEEPKST